MASLITKKEYNLSREYFYGIFYWGFNVNSSCFTLTMGFKQARLGPLRKSLARYDISILLLILPCFFLSATKEFAECVVQIRLKPLKSHN